MQFAVKESFAVPKNSINHIFRAGSISLPAVKSEGGAAFPIFYAPADPVSFPRNDSGTDSIVWIKRRCGKRYLSSFAG